MSGLENTVGEYAYLGIEDQLSKRVNHQYEESFIYLLIGIDGADVNGLQMWPLYAMIFDAKNQYVVRPFLVAVYVGRKKPKRSKSYLKDFVSEAKPLIIRGITIKENWYSFNIKAFLCDMPARSFIQCTKGHTGYESCDRCTTHGTTIKGTKKRIFPEENAPLRTNESFRLRLNPGHHHKKKRCILLDLPGFDIIKQIVIDPMHLYFNGLGPLLFSFWCDKPKNPGKLKQREKRLLGDNCDSIDSKTVTNNFQRKSLKMIERVDWKATQYRFILLYCGPFI